MDTEDLKIAIAVQTAWQQAFEKRDLDSLIGLYAEDTAFYGSTVDFHKTPSGVRTYFEVLPKSYTRANFAVPHVVRLGPHAMAATGEVMFYVELDGKEHERPFRMTHVLVEHDRVWKIATHHASPRPEVPPG